ncbi:hypothetical protein OE88DRAFT_1354706 [Heliocybe sulcata]|uniref:Uncharacterized protein n=1 Tax=Heliocybe sulcata TaxID=5364 RepID=A0A5C3NHY3_9AGAM|nr:hypothetical protein OE88DRAFT_1354706 [Heliocybe sulcata]
MSLRLWLGVARVSSGSRNDAFLPTLALSASVRLPIGCHTFVALSHIGISAGPTAFGRCRTRPSPTQRNRIQQ